MRDGIHLTLCRPTADAPDQPCDLCGAPLPDGRAGAVLADTHSEDGSTRVLCHTCARAIEGLLRSFGHAVTLEPPPLAETRAALEAEAARAAERLDALRLHLHRLAP